MHWFPPEDAFGTFCCDFFWWANFGHWTPQNNFGGHLGQHIFLHFCFILFAGFGIFAPFPTPNADFGHNNKVHCFISDISLQPHNMYEVMGINATFWHRTKSTNLNDVPIIKLSKATTDQLVLEWNEMVSVLKKITFLPYYMTMIQRHTHIESS